MFGSSPSFDASPPQATERTAVTRGGDETPFDEDGVMEDSDTRSAAAAEVANDVGLFPTNTEEEDEEEELDNDEEEEEEEEDEEYDDDDDDDDAADATTPGSTTTTPTTTTAPTTFPTTLPTTTAADTNVSIRAIPELTLDPAVYREMGKEALCWQLSSAKPGNGVEQIRDASTDTYWQSDGIKQPHWIAVHFARRVAISHVCLYLDYSLDESYTPKRVSISAGMTSQDLQPATTELEFAEPTGWCVIPLTAPPDPLDIYGNNNNKNNMPQQPQPIRAHLLRISILSMHQNGRDTHIRQCALYGPRRKEETPTVRAPRPLLTAATKNPRTTQPVKANNTQTDHPHRPDNEEEEEEDDDMDWRPLPLSIGGVIR
eukprot:scaffold7012_cov157-Amphora_coffeaeformis.AAC.14